MGPFLLGVAIVAGAVILLAIVLSRTSERRSREPGRARQTSRMLPGSRWRSQARSDVAKLRALGLPELDSTQDVLRWLRLSFQELLPLANHADRFRPNSSNYVEWTVPKKRGGERVIAAPKKRLKVVQLRILREILDRVPQPDVAHGFIRGRNIASNAAPHVGKAIVVNLDLADFFEHIRYPRVMGVFRRMGYSKESSRWLACLCTHRPRNSNRRWDPRKPRHAVQGAPTSPALANLAVHRLDARLAGLARRFECSYTRYADDLTFSGDEPFKRSLKRFLPLLRKIIASERFKLNLRKIRFARASARQEVTGVVVNRKVNARRADFDRLKAIVHNARKAGSLESQNREKRPHFRLYLLGRAAHLAQLNPMRGARLIAEIKALP